VRERAQKVIPFSSSSFACTNSSLSISLTGPVLGVGTAGRVCCCQRACDVQWSRRFAISTCAGALCAIYPGLGCSTARTSGNSCSSNAHTSSNSDNSNNSSTRTSHEEASSSHSGRLLDCLCAAASCRGVGRPREVSTGELGPHGQGSRHSVHNV
jgi:hypothetical protein